MGDTAVTRRRSTLLNLLTEELQNSTCRSNRTSLWFPVEILPRCRRFRASVQDLDAQPKSVFDYLAASFLQDYNAERLSVDQSGWRTRGMISDSTHLSQFAFYGKGGRFGPILKELISKGFIEMRFFPGERGRGGEVVKFRIAYEKDLVKRFIDKEALARR